MKKKLTWSDRLSRSWPAPSANGDEKKFSRKQAIAIWTALVILSLLIWIAGFSAVATTLSDPSGSAGALAIGTYEGSGVPPADLALTTESRGLTDAVVVGSEAETHYRLRMSKSLVG